VRAPLLLLLLLLQKVTLHFALCDLHSNSDFAAASPLGIQDDDADDDDDDDDDDGKRG
jgi:hypothetical protein